MSGPVTRVGPTVAGRAPTKIVRAPAKITGTRNTFCGTWYLPHSRVHKSMSAMCP